ncbi:hypothetical protein KVT40_008864 [Elsinoe batatas]|uniref:Uncharacterized protein n=1 Tax=Elsinoe batatas TaxID=2601811 RepID=A0A8K0L140_9PEZI|nr:hypothetical protein KVT40_008864 [Elsinoe batatas]
MALRPTALGLLVLLATLSLAQAQSPWYCGAVPLQQAAVAQCPQWATISCSSIGAAAYCCPAGTTCGWGGGTVGCCSSGQQCTGQPGAAYQQQNWQPQQTQCYDCAPKTVVVPAVVTQQPTTIYQQPTVTLVQPTTSALVGVGAPFTTSVRTSLVVQGFCSTQIASGPGLPTTAQGGCGTILIVAGAPPKLRIGFGIWLIPFTYILSILLL